MIAPASNVTVSYPHLCFILPSKLRGANEGLAPRPSGKKHVTAFVRLQLQHGVRAKDKVRIARRLHAPFRTRIAAA